MSRLSIFFLGILPIFIFNADIIKGQTVDNTGVTPRILLSDSSIIVKVKEVKGVLMSKEATNLSLKYKKIKSLKYWRPSFDHLSLFEEMVKKHLQSDEHTENQYLMYGDYFRQYFPYVNRKGELLLLVTFSILSEADFLREKDHLLTRYRIQFDGLTSYFSIKYNFSENDFFDFTTP